MSRIGKRLFIAFIAVILMIALVSCGDGSGDTDPIENDPPVSDSNESNDGGKESEDPAPESDGEGDEPSEQDSETEPDPDTEREPDESEESKDDPEDETEEKEEKIYNYLNGKTTTVEERDRRPVAIMINNIRESLPQVGITEGDIYYECSAEGGITRIMMLKSDYEKLGTVGSIRSSRDYFVDFLANHDAIYVHAGGSPVAYQKIIQRGINNIDGTNGHAYAYYTFWRDQERLQTMASEHTLMTSGDAIVKVIENLNYRTELDSKQVPLFKFYDEETDNEIGGKSASHVHMVSTHYQTVDFVYNKNTREYLRYQYNGQPHIDGKTGEQISVKNLFILFTDITLVPGDTSGRLNVVTVGSGKGYYMTNGEYLPIKWSRDGATDTMHLEYENGEELRINCGKTFICVVDDSVESTLKFNYKW